MRGGFLAKKNNPSNDDIDSCVLLVQGYLPIVTAYAYKQAINDSISVQDLYEINKMVGLLQSSWKGMLKEVTSRGNLA